MKFVVMGTGDFGGRYGGRLVHAGLDVTFIARGQRYDEITRHGLHTQADSQGRRIDLDYVQVTDSPSQVGPVDVVIFAVKNYHVEEAAAQITPLLGDTTVVLPVQNGVTAAARLATIVGRKYVLGYVTSQPHHAMGELDGPVSARVHAVCAVLKGAGVQIEAVDDIRVPLWDKLVTYAGGSPMFAARVDFGQAMASPEIRRLVWEGTEEAAAVARAEGANLAPGAGDRLLTYLDSSSQKNPRWRPSLLQDLDAGRRLELDDLVGVVVHKGTHHGIPTPVVRVCYMLLKPYEMGAARSGGQGSGEEAISTEGQRQARAEPRVQPTPSSVRCAPASRHA
jgi:2-dehydropantoate 2-reductase